jgi:hypothetical protein
MDRPVIYDPVFDEYRLVSTDGIPDPAVMTTCPRCAATLPPSKRELWFSEFDRLGLAPDDRALPERLQTDAWWSEQPERQETD